MLTPMTPLPMWFISVGAGWFDQLSLIAEAP
jgi:hypothetical protein